MRWKVAAMVASLACSGVARADDLYERLWPAVPQGDHLTLSQQITDELTALGNTLGAHLGALSYGELGLEVDGRHRRAHVRVGSSDTGRYLVFRLASDIQFAHGVALFHAKLDLGVGGHLVELELPDFEMAPTEVRGERGVEIRLPLFKRRF